MKKVCRIFTMFLFLSLIPVLCFASTVTLQWDANSETDLAGYKVYYAADSNLQPFKGVGATEGASPVTLLKVTTATLSNLDPSKTYYFAVTAYNKTGQESTYSNIVTVPAWPKAPINLRSIAINVTVTLP
jgi:chitinase